MVCRPRLRPLIDRQHFADEGDAQQIDPFIRDRIDGLLLQAPRLVVPPHTKRKAWP